MSYIYVKVLMEKIYIVTAGCSFTDAHIRTASNNKSLFIKTFFEQPSVDVASGHYSNKYQHYLLYELLKKNKSFEYYNCAMGSAGNHIIKHYYFKQINELLEKGIDSSKIYATIQLSGIYRPTDCADFFKNDTEEWKYDYMESNQLMDMHSYVDLINKHINNIIEIIDFNNKHNINAKIFWGWDNFSTEELIKYNLYEKYKELDKKQIINVFYNEKIDLMPNSPTNSFRFVESFFNKLLNKEEYKIRCGEFGGMLECVRENKKDSEYVYMTEWDMHLNSYGNYIFYRNFYRKLFEDWNLIDKNCIYDEEKYKTYLEKVEKVCSNYYKDSIGNYELYQNNDYIQKKRDENIKMFFSNII